MCDLMCVCDMRVQGSMDKIRFSKSMRDAGLVCECGALSSAASDAVFRKVLPPSKVSF